MITLYHFYENNQINHIAIRVISNKIQISGIFLMINGN